tara:strand:- start:8884 stop:9159 length:276 start_codon:yes stop_codon:yes gene_type:complete
MMTEWFFIIVTFVLANPLQDSRPLYVFTQPQFESLEQCIGYVEQNKNKIFYIAADSYKFQKQPETIYCTPQNVLGEMIREGYKIQQNEKSI